MSARDILIYLCAKNDDNWDNIYSDLVNHTSYDFKDMKQVIKQYCKKHKCSLEQVITIMDDKYPNQLKEVYKPPFIIIED